jgi:hypothetical protein
MSEQVFQGTIRHAAPSTLNGLIELAHRELVPLLHQLVQPKGLRLVQHEVSNFVLMGADLRQHRI